MLTRRSFLNSTLGAGLALATQGAQPVAAQQRRRIIVDSQIHMWKASTPDRPWAPGTRPQLPEPMTDVSLPDDAAAFLTECVGEGWSARALEGDASVRRYFRITLPDGETRMLAWYPDEVRRDLSRVLSAYYAASKHAYLPRLIQHSDAAMLQQDVGDETLFDLLHRDREEGIRWYRKAITLLVYFQKAGAVDR